MRTIPILTMLLILKNTQRMRATDACNGRCSQFEYVYCNPGTGVCDDCSIYCSSDSIFYDTEKCSELKCMEEPVTTDACGNRCIQFPDTYCNAGTGVCDSCSIYCTVDTLFYNSTKCTALCPDRLPRSTVKPLLTTGDNNVGTQTGDIVTSIHKSSTGTIGPGFIVATTRPIDNPERNATFHIGLFAGICVFCLLVIIVLFYVIWRKRQKRLRGYTDAIQEKPDEGYTGRPTIQEVTDEGTSEMVMGQEALPLNSSESKLESV